MRKILLLTTGGTIASTHSDSQGAVSPSLGAEALLGQIALPEGIEVTLRAVASTGSEALTLAQVHGFAHVIAREIDAYDGVVMTHGTDTMEETAFALELLLAPQKPVVLTGAQRHAGEPDADGPRNLRDALIAAADPRLGACGVVVLFEGDLHAARYVRKTHTSRVDAFRSGDFGKIGAVDAGQVSLRYQPLRLPALGVDHPPVEVGLITAAMGMGTELLRFARDYPYRAVVLTGFGRGNFPLGWAKATKELVAASKPVVVASRSPEGARAAIYGDDSGGVSMVEAGAYLGGDLSPAKLRVLLAFLLGRPTPWGDDELRAALKLYGA